MIRRPPRSTLDRSSAASDVYKRQRAGRVVQLGGKLDAGRARTDDRDVQLLGTKRLRLRVRAHVRVDEPAMKPLGLDGIVECDRVFVCAGRAEVVRAAADTDDE